MSWLTPETRSSAAPARQQRSAAARQGSAAPHGAAIATAVEIGGRRHQAPEQPRATASTSSASSRRICSPRSLRAGAHAELRADHAAHDQERRQHDVHGIIAGRLQDGGDGGDAR